MTEERSAVRPPVIDASLAAALEQYRGQWVAIDQGRVVAAGETLAEALDRAQAQASHDPLLYRVPAHPDRQAFYEARRDAVV
jgi:hypothetical protein